MGKVYGMWCVVLGIVCLGCAQDRGGSGDAADLFGDGDGDPAPSEPTFCTGTYFCDGGTEVVEIAPRVDGDGCRVGRLVLESDGTVSVDPGTDLSEDDLWWEYDSGTRALAICQGEVCMRCVR